MGGFAGRGVLTSWVGGRDVFIELMLINFYGKIGGLLENV